MWRHVNTRINVHTHNHITLSSLTNMNTNANTHPDAQAGLALLERWGGGGAAELLLPALGQYDTASYQVGVVRGTSGWG